MRNFWAFLIVVILTGWKSPVYSQKTTGRIGGVVVDGSQKTIASATIALLKSTDSTTIKFATADKNGRFDFTEIPFGRYRISVSATGHVKAFSEVINLSEENNAIEIKTLELIPLPKGLAEVTVVARKPFIEQKIDRTVINVDALVSNAGATALEVLEKSPGVTVDKEGNISLKGKQGVVVMMDGRPTYLSASELSNYLKNLPATAIEQIELMTNPSAKYDAAGNSGIINIKTKKNKQKGFNGSASVNYGIGRFWKTNNSLNLNYRTGKVNLFANASQGIWNGFQQLDIHRRFTNAQTLETAAIFDQTSNMRNTNNSYNLKIGMDFLVNKKTTLGIVTTGFFNPGTFSNQNTSFLQNKYAEVDSIVFASTRQTNSWKNGSVNVNMRHQYDSAGRELTADLDFISYTAATNQLFSNFTYNPAWVKKSQEDLRGDLPVMINIHSLKVDYTHPLKKEAKLEAGIKSSYVNTDNAANYFIVEANSEMPDYKKINHFIYKENIDAAYLNVNKQFKKVGVQAGLRYEYTTYTGHQFGNPLRTDSSFQKSYSNLFPTMYVSYAAGKSHQLAVSYGRRIDRPAYQDLNPFLFFIDKYTYQQGNPFLKPQYAHNIELIHIYKGFLTTTLNYSRVKDLNTETFEQGKNVNGAEEFATIVKRGNIGRREGAGISVNARIPVQQWWSAMVYTNYNYNTFQGKINGGEEINIHASNLVFNVNNQLTFKKGWSAEVSGFYRTKGLEGQIVIQPMGQLSAGVGKQVLKGKGTIKINVRDLLYTNYPRGTIHFQTTEARFQNRRDSRVANFTFSYRFGKPIKGNPSRKKTSGAEEEQNRIKVGGN